MPEPDARNSDVPNDLFGNLPTASSPLNDLPARKAPAPGSRRALREAAAREAAEREAAAREAAARESGGAPRPDVAPPNILHAAEHASVGAASHAGRVSDASGYAPVAATWPLQAQTPTSATASDSAESSQRSARAQHAEHTPDADQEPESPASGADRAPGAEEGGPLHELFAPDQQHDVPRKRRGRGCLIGVIILLVALGGIVAGGAWVWGQYGEKISEVMGWGEPKDYEPGLATGEAMVTIRSGDTGEPVSTALYEAGVTKTESVFYDYLISEGKAVTFYPGVYKLQQKMTAAAALEALENPANRMENTVRVAEGGTVRSTLPLIAEGVGIPIEELQTAIADPSAYGVAAEKLEGWLFPAVYTFDPGATAQDVIAAMVARTQESLDAAGVPAGDAQRVLTIASIIQREGHTADFDKVSRVIANRLDPANDETHGLLQMDSTAQYGYGLTHEGPVSSWPWEAVVGDQNAWNTYVHTGLPATPISNPSDAAIRAAANPADGPWFYFVTVNLDTGETVFSATYAEQQKAEAEYRKWCEDNPDGGCY